MTLTQIFVNKKITCKIIWLYLEVKGHIADNFSLWKESKTTFQFRFATNLYSYGMAWHGIKISCHSSDRTLTPWLDLKFLASPNFHTPFRRKYHIHCTLHELPSPTSLASTLNHTRERQPYCTENKMLVAIQCAVLHVRTARIPIYIIHIVSAHLSAERQKRKCFLLVICTYIPRRNWIRTWIFLAPILRAFAFFSRVFFSHLPVAKQRVLFFFSWICNILSSLVLRPYDNNKLSRLVQGHCFTYNTFFRVLRCPSVQLYAPSLSRRTNMNE